MDEIEVAVGVLNDSMRCVAAAITQRHAGEVVASLSGRKRNDDFRASMYHWYYLWNGEWGSDGHDFSEGEELRLRELKAELQNHPWVYCFREED